MVAALRPVAAPHRRATGATGFSWAAAALAALVAVPLLWAAASAVEAGLDAAAWRALGADLQLPQALLLSAFTGLAATALSVAITAWALSRTFDSPAWASLIRLLPPMLATPHAAFAIGLAFLVSPSGWILRALSPWATGFDSPPAWLTTQDPWGLGVVAVLVAKEVPFLLWAAITQLQRPDAARRWSRELAVSRTMGYAARTAWWRVLWPQLWPRLGGPFIAVLAYSLTVVDMALVIGPTSPPTLAVLAWQWLLDADAATNAKGAAAAWLLAGLVAVTASSLWGWLQAARKRHRAVDGRRGRHAGRRARPSIPAWALAAPYLAVLLALITGSVSGVWPFPDFWPQSLSLAAWQSVAVSSAVLWSTLGLALASSLTALAWAIAWLEWAPERWRFLSRPLIYLPLLLPSVLWVVGMHRLALDWALDARWSGLWLAHSLAALPYVLIALGPAYLGFDPRLQQVAAAMGRPRGVFLWRVKWPLLKASLWAAAAVGFAVSAAQFLPTLFIGAGRFATVTTEAVTLASGAQRSLTAAYAWLQWLLPVLAFAVAARAGRPRRFESRGGP
jgi:putative thiamine transport system permease protein